jgi:hypothetical protein
LLNTVAHKSGIIEYRAIKKGLDVRQGLSILKAQGVKIDSEIKDLAKGIRKWELER